MMTNIAQIDDSTPDLKQELLSRLKSVVPEAFSDGHLDLDRLAELAGDAVATGPERYGLAWPGKREAIAMLQAPSRGTLVPEREQSVNFNDARHVFIEGDNLEVLKLLYKSYFGRVKLIYIDPPYNTANDLIYNDDFSDPLAAYFRQTGQMTQSGDMTTSAPEKSGRKHSNWLSMMYPRLSMARQMLCDQGMICVSCDDIELSNLRSLLDEVFGEENFIATFIWKKMDSPSRNDEDRYTSSYHDYIIAYARDISSVGLKKKYKPEILKAYPLRLSDGKLARRRQLRKNGKSARRSDRETMWYPLTAPDGTEVWPTAREGWEGRWVLSKETWEERFAAGRGEWIKRKYGWVPYYIEVAPDTPGVPWPTLWDDLDQNRQAAAEFTELVGRDIQFDNPKPTSLIKRILSIATGGDDICLDFFGGAGSTAHAVLSLNEEDGSTRRFITVQLPEYSSAEMSKNGFPTISAIARHRIQKAIERVETRPPSTLFGDENESDGEANRDEREPQGFRAFRLSTSNIRRWAGIKDATPESYMQQMDAFADTLLPGWNAEGVIWEVAVREGFPLTASITAIGETTPPKFWRVSDDEQVKAFTISLADHIDLESVKALGLTKADVFVCRDTALNDTIAANLALQCTLKVL
jgi:adenine-specific DNA-methyltransferase